MILPLSKEKDEVKKLFPKSTFHGSKKIAATKILS
jgi:hypothetical protein